MKPHRSTSSNLPARGLHQARGNWRLGLALSAATVVLWGFLSINLKLLLENMDGYTITWYRMTTAAVFLAAFQARKGKLPDLRRLDRRGWTLLATSVLGLLGNYVLFVVALDFVSPATAQVVIQLAPLLFMLGGLFFFRESFVLRQWIGLALLIAGLLLFFNDRLPELANLTGRYGFGVALVVAAGLVWAAYALAQKQLLLTFESQNILLLIYVAGFFLLLPLSSPPSGHGARRFRASPFVSRHLQHSRGLWLFCRGAGALGGLAGERGDRHRAPGHDRGGLSDLDLLAGSGHRPASRRRKSVGSGGRGDRVDPGGVGRCSYPTIPDRRRVLPNTVRIGLFRPLEGHSRKELLGSLQRLGMTDGPRSSRAKRYC